MAVLPSSLAAQRAIIYIRESDVRMYPMLDSQREACRT